MNRFEPCHTTRLLKQIFRQKLCPSSGKKIQGMKIGERQWWKKREIITWGKRMGEKPGMNWGKDEAREYNWEREKKRLIGNDPHLLVGFLHLLSSRRKPTSRPSPLCSGVRRGRQPCNHRRRHQKLHRHLLSKLRLFLNTNWDADNKRRRIKGRGGHPDWVIPDQPFLLPLFSPSLILPSIHPRFLTRPLPSCVISLFFQLCLSLYFHSLYLAWWRTE